MTVISASLSRNREVRWTITDFFFRTASISKNVAAKVLDGSWVDDDLVDAADAPAAKKSLFLTRAGEGVHEWEWLCYETGSEVRSLWGLWNAVIDYRVPFLLFKNCKSWLENPVLNLMQTKHFRTPWSWSRAKTSWKYITQTWKEMWSCGKYNDPYTYF